MLVVRAPARLLSVEQTAQLAQSQRDGPTRTARAEWASDSSPRLSWKPPVPTYPPRGQNCDSLATRSVRSRPLIAVGRARTAA